MAFEQLFSDEELRYLEKSGADRLKHDLALADKNIAKETFDYILRLPKGN